MDGAAEEKGSSGSSSNTPALVMDSLPFGGDEVDTLPLHSKEMDLLAEEFKNTPAETYKGFVPEAPTVTCIYHGGIFTFSMCVVGGRPLKQKTQNQILLDMNLHVLEHHVFFFCLSCFAISAT